MDILLHELFGLLEEPEVILESAYLHYEYTFGFTMHILEAINNIQKLEVSKDEMSLKISDYLDKQQSFLCHLSNGEQISDMAKNGRIPKTAYENFNSLHSILSKKKLAK